MPQGLRVSFARWAPDGKQIYATEESQTRRGATWVVSVSTGTFRKLVDDVSVGPWPSPDGRLLAFVPSGKGPGPGNEIWVTSRLDGRPYATS